MGKRRKKSYCLVKMISGFGKKLQAKLSYELLCREIEKKEIHEEELLLPSLKHVEQEGKPEEKKKYKPDAKTIEEPSEYELVFKRRQSQVTDLTKNSIRFILKIQNKSRHTLNE